MVSVAVSEDDIEFTDEDDSELDPKRTEEFSEAVLNATDWTVETVVSQLVRKNIDMNPRFQRRDAWNLKAKSRFIESIVLGLPIPQIVLAEKRGERGKFIVIDGKQRLLSLLQFTGNSDGKHNSFALSGMEARGDLNRIKYKHLDQDAKRVADLNAFLNHTIRTVVIRNWPSTEFMHLVFLRLNTGSVKLSPQELRQAMVPGPFSDFADDEALKSKQVQVLLSRTSPDPRMRDVEIIVRYMAFRHEINAYAGRMKAFLDQSCQKFNADWDALADTFQADMVQFNEGVDALKAVFGADRIARKGGSRSFNRAIFDALIFYAADLDIRTVMLEKPQVVTEAYQQVLATDAFSEAVESDTAGIPHTLDRLRLWGLKLKEVLEIEFNIPEAVEAEGAVRITYAGH